MTHDDTSFVFTAQDILQNDAVALDWVFRLSFITDLMNALLCIQNSPLQQHGRLTSKCCYIDKRFLLKVGDYGLSGLYDAGTTVSEPADLLWTAPELLRASQKTGIKLATPEGDVFSFAIILQEIILRESPYYLNNITVDRKRCTKNVVFLQQ